MKYYGRIIAGIVGVSFMLGLFGCMGKKYSVDYGESIGCFTNAKESYRAGETVCLEVYIATDTTYTFKVDGDEISPDFSDNGGALVYTFTMPDHDIVIDFSSKNTMVFTDTEENENTETLLFDYYSAALAVVGDAQYTELTVTRTQNGLFVTQYFGEGDKETKKVYRADEKILGAVDEITSKYRMDKWNELPERPLTAGGIKVVKFIGADGKLIRVSTDRMPEDGANAFGELRNLLGTYTVDENAVED